MSLQPPKATRIAHDTGEKPTLRTLVKQVRKGQLFQSFDIGGYGFEFVILEGFE